VSSEKQDYDRQILELNEYCAGQGYGVTKMITTKITGSKVQKDRPDIIELLKCARTRQFDKVLVTEISRIGRNAKDIRNTISELHASSVGIIFKNLGGLESLDENGEETFVTNIIIAIYSEMAQEERRGLVDRIKSGLHSAKAKGKTLGRPFGKEESGTFLNKYKNVALDLRCGISIRKAMKVHDLSKGTVLKIRSAMKNGS
jgi:DNA invertase Pin-like site-specific DNA recombinase